MPNVPHPPTLKAQWVVTAGLIPEVEDEALRRVWHYTGAEYDTDAKLQGREGPSVYFMRAEEAMSYLAWASNPNISNWTRFEFMWL